MTGSITRIPALVKSAVKVYKPLNGSWLVVGWKKGDDYSMMTFNQPIDATFVVLSTCPTRFLPVIVQADVPGHSRDYRSEMCITSCSTLQAPAHS